MIRPLSWLCAAALLIYFSSGVCAEEPVPVTGQADTRFAPIEDVVRAFQARHAIPGATVAVAIRGSLAFNRGYGWRDAARTTPVAPDALFRLASSTKPLTAAAARLLVRQGKLALDTPVFPLLGLTPPAGSTPDPRLARVTVAHLIEHQGGWDKDTSPIQDPCWNFVRIGQALGLSRAAGARDIATYMAGQPLEFEPGSRTVYSNVGYLLLGLVIEKAAGKPCLDVINEDLLKPAGIAPFRLGRSRKADCDSAEVEYCDPRRVRSVVEEAPAPVVPFPYGGFAVEERYAYGGLVASAPQLLAFMDKFGKFGGPVEETRPDAWHTGHLPGVRTVMIWRPDGLNIVLLFNQRVDGRGVEYDVGDLVRDLCVAAEKVAGGLEKNK